MTGLRQPNVLIMHCHDAGRFLGCYGVPTVRTPSLDALASEGVRFENAFCTAPQCSPSRAALFTGRYPHNTGVLGLTHRTFAWDLHPSSRHLAAVLGEAGYSTELVGVHHESRRLPDPEVAAQLGLDRVATGGRADEVAARAIETLRARASEPDTPFYVQVGFTEPHRLGTTTENGTRMGFIGDYIKPDDTLGVTIPGYLRDDSSTREEMAELQGAVSYMDAASGRVLTVLDDLGLAENTIVVFTTDHGLALPRAKCTLYDPGLETALIMRAPSLAWDGGRVVSDLVSNVDIMPTLLDAIGLPVPDNVHGQSLAATLSDRGGGPHRDCVFGELTFHSYYDPRRCVRTATHKLIVNFDSVLPYMSSVSQSWRPWSTPTAASTGLRGNQDDPVELYDLESDPLEMTNLADDRDHRELVDQLRHRLLTWMQDTDDPLLAGPPPSPAYHRARLFLDQV